MNHNLTNGQKSVLRAFGVLGEVNDGALAAYVHHMDPTPQSSSSVRSRRCELVRKGFVTARGTQRLKSGRVAAIHGLTLTGTRALRAVEAEDAQAVTA